ncbi:hypothetical protein [Mycobacterium lacus]|uniref:Uncharacterized protein n=1 Tax=Mycobacterium lacus TaxID=169765 RepID=A0A7I7NK79_9MYCO|nr:hypothetical protein [Mycobacterium lacus]BBX95907.1 hypothetical protein MLAC_12010 [Mycobacterium lacus]
MSEQQWRDRWTAARMFLTADGETGKAAGNETIRVDESGQLRIKVPAALVDRFGTHLHIAAPVAFGHRCQEWADRVAGRRAVRYDITFNPAKGRWYLDASWTTTPGAHARGAARRAGAGGPQRRSPRRVCPGLLRQPGRCTRHDSRRHRRFTRYAPRWAG